MLTSTKAAAVGGGDSDIVGGLLTGAANASADGLAARRAEQRRAETIVHRPSFI